MKYPTESDAQRFPEKFESQSNVEFFQGKKFPRNTRRFVLFSLFFIVLFPKAGIRSGGIPIYLSTFLFFTLTFILLLSKNKKTFNSFLMVYVIYLVSWLAIVIQQNDIFLLSNPAKAAAISWFLVSPIFWIAASSHRDLLISPKIIDFFFVILTIYAVFQFFFGLDFFRINGLTIAYGDSYATKNLAIFQNKTVIGIKAPSTYQSGNMFGQVAALFFVWGLCTDRFKTYKSKVTRLIIPLSYLVAIAFSLSRTAIIAVLMGIFLHTIGSKVKSLFPYIPFIALFLYVVSNNSVFQYRFSLDNFLNSAGRVESWSAALNSYTLKDWILGRSGTRLVSTDLLYLEGLFGLIAQVGIIGLILLIFAWFKSGLFRWSAFTATFGVCLIIDSAFINPPFMWIPGICILLSEGRSYGKYGRQNKVDKL